MDYVPLLKRLRMKYPHATEEELWHGVAFDCYIRSAMCRARSSLRKRPRVLVRFY